MHALGIISKLLISPPRHGRYWAVKPIALPGDNSPKNSCKGNFTLGARGFSYAVFGFAARVFRRRVGLRPTKLPSHGRINLWYPG